MLLPFAYIGPFHRRKNPLLRLLPRVYLASDEAPYFLMQLAPLQEKGTATPGLIRFPEGTVLDKEIQETDPSSAKTILLDKAARRLLANHAAFSFRPNDRLDSPSFYHEGTSLFSGPEVRRQVAVFSLCAGVYLKSLPPVAPGSGAAWFSFPKLLDAIRQTGARNTTPWSAESSPYGLEGLVPANEAKGAPLPMLRMAATDVYLLERLALYRFVTGASDNAPKDRKEWVPEEDLLAALKGLEGGRYLADDRLENSDDQKSIRRERYNYSSFRRNQTAFRFI